MTCFVFSHLEVKQRYFTAIWHQSHGCDFELKNGTGSPEAAVMSDTTQCTAGYQCSQCHLYAKQLHWVNCCLPPITSLPHVPSVIIATTGVFLLLLWSLCHRLRPSLLRASDRNNMAPEGTLASGPTAAWTCGGIRQDEPLRPVPTVSLERCNPLVGHASQPLP